MVCGEDSNNSKLHKLLSKRADANRGMSVTILFLILCVQVCI